MNYNLCDSEKDIRLVAKCNQPLDTVTQILWSQLNPITFWTVGWDAYARYYTLTKSTYGSENLQQLYSLFLDEPITCCSWDQTNNILFVGQINGEIKAIQLNNDNSIHVIAKLEVHLIKIFWVPQMNVLISMGGENKIQFWQLGVSTPALSLKVDDRIVTADLDYPFLMVVNMSDKYSIINLQSQDLKIPPFMTTPLDPYSKILCVKINKKTQKWLMGSMDGRCALQSFETSYSSFSSKNQVIFKGQFKKQGLKFLLMQVNTVSFNRDLDDWIAVGGGDSTLVFYELNSRELIKTLKFKSPVTVAECSPSGEYIAYALGADWTQGLKQLGMYEAKIVVHRLRPDDKKKSR